MSIMMGVCMAGAVQAAPPPSTTAKAAAPVDPLVQQYKYKAQSVHDAKWLKAHPNAQPKGWIKTLPHRYRVVKVHGKTYYFANHHYYQRSGTGFVVVKPRF